MIAKLRGLVDAGGEDWVVIDVGGVGYLVHASARTLARLPGPGEGTSLLIETHVREDHIHLYGFAESSERDWFRLLTTVQGVGSKVALALLSVYSPEQLSRCIAAQDKAALTRASGVGPRLAARILSELKDKVAVFPGIGPGIGPGAPSGVVPGGIAAASASSQAGSEAAEDAVSALVNLGYERLDAFGAVDRAARTLGPEAAVQALIAAALKDFATGRGEGR